jgi:hypothetical protein
LARRPLAWKNPSTTCVWFAGVVSARLTADLATAASPSPPAEGAARAVHSAPHGGHWAPNLVAQISSAERTDLSASLRCYPGVHLVAPNLPQQIGLLANDRLSDPHRDIGNERSQTAIRPWRKAAVDRDLHPRAYAQALRAEERLSHLRSTPILARQS